MLTLQSNGKSEIDIVYLDIGISISGHKNVLS
jgi:hypothetical protein